jgi:hypothetical protein
MSLTASNSTIVAKADGLRIGRSNISRTAESKDAVGHKSLAPLLARDSLPIPRGQTIFSHTCIFALLAFTAALTVAQSDEARPHPEIRKAIVERFPYNSQAKALSVARSNQDPTTVTTVDPEIVILPPFEVRSRLLDRNLTAAIENWRPPSPQNHSRFGTGIHEKDIGKVRAGVVTVLYIPILVGFSW